MKTLDVEKWRKRERFADAYGMVSTCVALMVSAFGLLSVWAIDWPSSMIPVAMICLAWLNLAWAWRRYCYCTGMLAVAKLFAEFDEEEEDDKIVAYSLEIEPIEQHDDGGITIVSSWKTKRITPIPPAPKMKPPKKECEYIFVHRCPDDVMSFLKDGTKFCPRCGKEIL